MKQPLIITLCSVCCRSYRNSGTRELWRTKDKRKSRCSVCYDKKGYSYYCEPIAKNGGKYY